MHRTVAHAAIVPGAIVLSGVFLWHFGLYAAIAIHSVGLLSSLGVAMLPMLNQGPKEHRKERQETELG